MIDKKRMAIKKRTYWILALVAVVALVSVAATMASGESPAASGAAA